MHFLLLLASCLMALVTGDEACQDGAVLSHSSSRPSMCSNYARRKEGAQIEIDGYEQHWELDSDNQHVAARMVMGFKVNSGSITKGFKSITDNADAVKIDQLQVLGPVWWL